MAGAVKALAVTALGAPASATHGKGTIGIVNGIPGQRVDLCINGKEIKSRAPYGGRAFRSLPVGDKLVKIFKADPRKCKGKKLGQKAIELTDDADWTIVINKKFPKFVMFDNAGLGMIPPDGPDFPKVSFAFRHAADLGKVNFFIATEGAFAPATHPIWREGDSASSDGSSPGLRVRLRATRPHKAKTLAQTKFIEFEAGRRYEMYLLGTAAKNAKIINWSRAVSLPTP